MKDIYVYCCTLSPSKTNAFPPVFSGTTSTCCRRHCRLLLKENNHLLGTLENYQRSYHFYKNEDRKSIIITDRCTTHVSVQKADMLLNDHFGWVTQAHISIG